MAKTSKNRREALAQYDRDKVYPLSEAVSILKKITKTKFDASVDLDIRLGIDPKKSDQSLPHGTGKEVKVLVLCTPDKEEEAKNAGADYVGLDEYVTKIQGGWTDIDVVITMPTVMAKVGRLGRILGPRGLMPNPKSGTVTMDIAEAVKGVKAGKIDFKVDKTGIIHTSIGKVSFEENKLEANIRELLNTLTKLKPASAKGTYFQSIYVSSTMSPSIAVDKASVTDVA